MNRALWDTPHIKLRMGHAVSKLRELRQVFDALDEHDDGEVGRDELLASLDLHHSHLMAYLKSCPAIATTADEAEGTVSPRHAQGHGGNRWRSSGTLTARPTELGAVIGLQASSAFDAIEAIDCDYIGWEEVSQNGHTLEADQMGPTCPFRVVSGKVDSMERLVKEGHDVGTSLSLSL